NTRLSSLLSESNNTSFHDCDNDFVNSNTSFSEYDDNFEKLSVPTFHYDKNQNDPDIIHQKSYHYSSDGIYKAYKVASIIQLEILKKKYLQHVFYRQDVYNAIYKLHQNDNERSDSVSLFDRLFEKMSSDPRWKIFIRYTGNEHQLSEDIVDEPQATLKAILDNTNMSKIIEKWRIHRIGGLSYKKNLVVLLNDRTYIYEFLDNSLVLTALESSSEYIIQANDTLQSLQNFQSTGYQSNIQHVISQKNKFGIAFSTAKMVINVALETKCDNKLIQLLKTFILIKQNSCNKNDNSEEAESSKNNLNSDNIITLQQDLIEQTNNPHVTKIQTQDHNTSACYVEHQVTIKKSVQILKKTNLYVYIYRS
ncbi:10818_t:CDS:2, partial [Racocetra fulgida]